MVPDVKPERTSDLKVDLASLRIDRQQPPRRRRRWPLFLFLPVIALFAVLYGLRLRQLLQGVEVSAVTVAGPGPGTSSAGTAVLTASGYLVPSRKAVVSAKIQGRLSELRVEEGSRVREGEIIARLENSDFKAQKQRAAATIMKAEADLAEFRRQTGLAETLAREKIVSQDDLAAARSRVRIAEAVLEQARADAALSQAQYENTLIRAPFDGVILKKMAEVGESVAPIPPGVNLSTSSGAIVALADLDTLEVEADVAESSLSKISVGQPAEIVLDALPDTRFRGRISRIVPTVDRAKATVMTKVKFDAIDPRILPEMSAKVSFLSQDVTAEQQKPMVAVAADAIVQRDGRAVVFVIKEGTAVAVPVTPGKKIGDLIAIAGDVKSGEKVVLKPAENFASGALVKVAK